MSSTADHDAYPLTPLQQGMLLHSLRSADPDAYVIHYLLRLRRPVDVSRLRRAWHDTVQRHEALRSAPCWKNLERPEMVVRSAVGDVFSFHDWRDTRPERRDARWRAFTLAEHRRGFDLDRPPLARLALLQLGEADYELVLLLHHVILDGRSALLLLRDLFATYDELASGRRAPRQAPLPARGFVDWLERRDPSADRTFWRATLAGLEPAGPLPGDPAPITRRGYGERAHVLSSRATERLRSLAAERDLSVATFVHAAWARVLARCSGRDDVVFGATVSGRFGHLPEAGRMLGVLVNTVPLRIPVPPDGRLSDWLDEVRRRWLALRGHEHASLVDIRRYGGLPRGRAPFHSLVNFERIDWGAELRSVSEVLADCEGRKLREGSTDCPLSLVARLGPRLRLVLGYDRGRYRGSTVGRWLDHLAALIEAMVDAPDRSLSELPPLGERERRRIATFNPAPTEYPRPALHELFERQAARTPDAVALVSQRPGGERVEVRYAELNRRANRLARHLLEASIVPETPVGVCLERSVDLVVAILAVLKAGGAYVPLDPEYPTERLGVMLRDSGAAVVLAREDTAARLPAVGARVVRLDAEATAIEARSDENPRVPVPAEGLAYVMYTSGSTGRPKGVAVPHRAVARLVCGTDYVELGPREVLLLLAPASFDASTFELWGALLHGATLAVAPPGPLSLPELGRTIREHGVTTLWLTAGLFHRMVDERADDLAGVRQLLAGGDVLSPTHVRRALGALRDGRVIDGYGPTEGTTFTTCHVMRDPTDAGDPVPIGRPIANTRVHVLDARMRPVPIGAPGELYIGGDGLARGYHGRPGATAERFVPDPFGPEPGGRLYRTGDLVRLSADGRIRFLRRIDQQVKVRGFRIEPDEVEGALREHPGVRDAAVGARGDEAGERRLVAWLVPEDAPGAGELRAFLATSLPEFMIPSAFVPLASLPLTSRGKVDRRALPDPSAGPPRAEHARIAPRTPTEETLAAIWSELLGIEGVGVDDDFFELGGHSLLATQVASRVQAALGVELPLREILDRPTVAALALLTDAASSTGSPRTLESVPVALRPDPLPPSFAQQRLYFMDRLAPQNAFYNVPLAVRLDGPLEVDALDRALREIVARHEALRTVFGEIGGVPFQRVLADQAPELSIVDLRGVEGARLEEEARQRVGEAVRAPFDLAGGPLLRALLLRLRDDRHVLAVVMHHIASDGWSVGVLFRELTALYDAFANERPSPLPPLDLQYADYALWQRERLSGALLARHLAYWTERLADLPVLRLPADRPRPASPTFAGAAETLDLDPELSVGLDRLSRREGATLYMTLLAAFQALLQRYTGETDVVVGSPIANRTRAELEGLIGFFVNTLVLRTDVSGDPTFVELLHRVREVAAGAYAHQDLPFERIVEELGPERDLSRNPLFQVGFALQNAPVEPLRFAGVRLSPQEFEVTTARFDLEVHVRERDDGLRVVAFYMTDVFDAATVRALLEHYATLLRAVVAQPERRLSDVEVLSAGERRRALVEWNDTDAAWPVEGPVHQRIEEQARSAPESVAAVSGGRALTYGELERRSNRLARHLVEHGVGRDVPVGVCLERDLELPLAFLAILKAGGAYLPLDPAHPDARLARMVEAARAPVVLTRHAQDTRFGGACVVSPEQDRTRIERHSDEPLDVDVAPHDLAYVMFTSGSTGEPKGVMVEHRGLSNLAEAQRVVFAPSPGSRHLQFASIAFDASVFEILMALRAGGALYLESHASVAPGPALGEFLERNAITHVTLTPSTLAALPDADLPRLETIVCAGEPCPAGLARRWSAGRRFFNAYGPTEGTVWSTVEPCSDDDPAPPIGLPVANTTAHVLDDRLRPVPVGVVGELYLGGAGLARGYLGDPGLTAERFVPDPFAAHRGERLYRTGDLARRRADGRIDFVGRRDRQLKLRGVRIEPAEIEAALVEHPAVRETVVELDRREGHGDRLVAYLVPDPAAPDDASEGATLAEDRVEQWRELYDRTYELPGGSDPTFNTIGWNSSFTGEPFPADEMREWVDGAVERVLALDPAHVLEIGCGSGLLLFRIAPRCERYFGTDLSESALDHVRGELERPGWEHASVFLQAADDFAGLPPGGFDTVVLNSVIQYFPNVDYLLRVLDGALRVLAPGGSIFIGDVRNLRLLETLQAAVLRHRHGSDEPGERQRERVRRAVAEEEELLVDPAFFEALPRRYAGIGDVEVSLKCGRCRNELNAYRYDVVLRTGEISRGPEPEPLRWRRDVADPAALRERLARDGARAFEVDDVPNARVLDAAHALDPETLRELGGQTGRAVRVEWSDLGPDRFRAVFLPTGDGDAPVAPPPRAREERPWHEYTNRPLAAVRARRLTDRLRAFAAERLPEAMVPSAWMVLDELPRAPSGKPDRRALPAPEPPRPVSAEPSAAPRTEIEEQLVEIWSAVLGLDRVGIHDNFFGLGGDSIQSLQIVARASEAGLHLTARQLFENQTVAEQAAVVSAAAPAPADLEPETGPAPLTPIQRWFFEQGFEEPSHFNHAIALQLPDPLSRERWRRLLGRLVDRHDALRLRFREGPHGFTQSAAEPGVGWPVEWIRLQGETDGELAAERREAAARLHGEIDLFRDRLLHAAVLHDRSGRPSFLLLVLHHLVVDVVSWGILLRDLERLYADALRGTETDLGAPPERFLYWARRLDRVVASGGLDAERSFWERVATSYGPRLPVDRADGDNTIASMRLARYFLDAGETRALVHELPGVYGTTAHEALLAALARAFARFGGSPRLAVDLEAHGREEEIGGVDVSRTVGWFTSLYPVVLDVTSCDDAGRALLAVKDQLRAVPNRGMGYGLLRFLGDSPALRNAATPEVVFNYLGRLPRSWSEGLGVTTSEDDVGPLRSPRARRAHLLEIEAAEVDGRMRLTIAHSADVHRPETIERLGAAFVAELRELIGHALTRDSGAYSPSDFPEADLTQDELDDIVSAAGEAPERDPDPR
jgi:amino acid adenylation domain-containing protein/non-ribosomal peptide synthase protein (TIGR01720 family)